ncbi:MAG: diguanylate cyclase [Spirochaetes bacterium]|nr:diguanylate cyclase [Spirochaetota bacterium]
MPAMIRTPQKLGLKASLLIAALLSALGLLQAAGLLLLSLQSYNQIENIASRDDVSRIQNAVQDEKQRLLDVAKEYGAWDDTRNYVLGSYPEYIADNFGDEWLAQLDMDLIAVADASTRVLWSWGNCEHDYLGIGTGLPVLASLTENSAAAAWDMGRAGLFLVAAWPVTNTSFNAEPVGWIIMGRNYDGRLQEHLSERTGLTSGIFYSLVADPGEAGEAAAIEPVFFNRDSLRIFHIPVKNLQGELLGTLELSRERPLLPVFTRVIVLLVIFTMLTVLTAALALRLLLRSLVIRPLETISDFLQARARGLTRSLPLSLGTACGRTDEIGQVADHIDDLLAALNKRQQDLELANIRLEEKASIDPLTGLANRRRFDEHIDHELRRMSRLYRQSQPEFFTSILLCDLDHFKLYNDYYGHQAGDECLRTVADLLRSCLHRPGDMACRYGGEEFVIILPGTGLDGAQAVAERLMQTLCHQALPHADSPTAPQVTISIGVAGTNDCESREALELAIARADSALYQAKRNGRNRLFVSA